MSELTNPRHEKSASETALSKEDLAEIQERQHEKQKEAQERAKAHEDDKQSRLEQIRESVEQQAEKSNDIQQEKLENEEPNASDVYWKSREYSNVAYRQTLNKTRKRMTKPERAVSRIIHQPVVERFSEIGEKTFARPSGVLAGSVCSFIASTAVYIFARRNGYDMTYTIFIATFVGGFLIGVAAEFLYRGVKELLSRR